MHVFSLGSTENTGKKWGKEAEKRRQSVKDVSSSQLPLWVTGLNAAEKLGNGVEQTIQ